MASYKAKLAMVQELLTAGLTFKTETWDDVHHLALRTYKDAKRYRYIRDNVDWPDPVDEEVDRLMGDT
jgi:hypothetical protein